MSPTPRPPGADRVVHLPSGGGVEVAVHHLGGPDDPAAPVLLLSHATGFHARVWEPMASHLTHRYRCVALDYRGHGLARTPEDAAFDWGEMADDLVAVLDSDLLGEGPVLGAGHSMGGAMLLVGAARRPGRVAALWLYEPIVAPPDFGLGAGPNPMAEAARRRRDRFESLDAAVANYAAKPPLDQLHPDALRAYVEGGFEVLDDGTAVLRCRPGWEAATFEGAGGSGAWDLLGRVGVPVAVLAGGEEVGPAAFAPHLAAALPHGELVRHPELGHFGPLQAPAELAAELAAWAARHWAG